MQWESQKLIQAKELHYVILYMDTCTLFSPTWTKNSCPSVTPVCTKVRKMSEITIQNKTQCLLGPEKQAFAAERAAGSFLPSAVQLAWRQHHMAQVQRTCSGGITIAQKSLHSYAYYQVHVIRPGIFYLSLSSKCLIKYLFPLFTSDHWVGLVFLLSFVFFPWTASYGNFIHIILFLNYLLGCYTGLDAS